MNEKKTLFVSVIAILAIIIIAVGATYAYFQAQVGEGKSVDISVTTSTVDSLAFSVGDSISFKATQTTFASGLKSLYGTTSASASLLANNTSNSATYYYDLLLDIETNEFEYTVDSSTPELLLTITDPTGAEVTSIYGLTYYSSVSDNTGATYSGFDITTLTTDVTLASAYTITSSSSDNATEQSWTVTVTFINLDSDQYANTDKEFTASLQIYQTA